MDASLLAVLGPTCSWKSEVGILLAERLGAEILSCDSMQVYRDMDIGTAKPGQDERRRVRHHLIDVFDIHEPYNAERFSKLAKKIHNNLKGRGIRSILVGGTGLYARTFLYGLNLLPADPDVLRELTASCQSPEGRKRLEEELIETARNRGIAVPPDVLANSRRLTRACEVLRLTGKLPWELHRGASRPPCPYPQFCLLPTMDVLRERIRQRTIAMLEAGWIEETRRLIGKGLLQTPTARQALGYRDIASYLERGEDNREKLAEILIGRTVAYARRQRTWFRHQHPGAYTIEIDTPQTAAPLLVDRIMEFLNP